jgi:hypothetical protein
MTWEYNQTTGEMRHNGQLVGTGYSGAGTTTATGRNNPAMESTANAGPIPAGTWQIGTAVNSSQTGPNSIPLTPVGHNAYGRTAFEIHGNNTKNDASHGCIIMPPTVRQQIIDSGDTTLRVVPGTAPPTPPSTPTPGANTPVPTAPSAPDV